MKKTLVSVIMPTYRHEKIIKENIANVYDALNQTRWNFELIIVVDGSDDNTYEEALKSQRKGVKVYNYKKNRGKGYAVRYGMARANGDLVAFIDTGMEINPNGISMLLEHMEWYDADIIVGSKRHPASKVNMSPFRRLYSWGYYLGVKLLFGLRVGDTQAGIKVFKKEVLEQVLPRLLVKEFAFDVELLAVARYLGFAKIYDAPIEIDLGFGETSKITKNIFIFTNPYIRKMLWDTMAVFYRIYVLDYYSDSNNRLWEYDDELQMRINTGELG